jgi:3-hydroxyethyl bacteriochlorophyllide a dehydrogenase
MKTLAVVLDKPEQLRVAPVALRQPEQTDIVVETDWTGISTGTEKLLYTGRMPPFPGMGYPLVPGYECTGRVISAGADAGLAEGQRVFVPGSHSFTDVRGLFGGSAARLVADASKVVPINDDLGENAVLLALAATAHHAATASPDGPPQLIVGHGVLGRLIARIVIALGAQAPVVWETAAARRSGALGYEVVAPEDDAAQGYERVCDASGADDIVDVLVGKLSRGGEIVLAGFYEGRVSFAFPPAFMREMRLRIAAEWSPRDMNAVLDLVNAGKLALDGLISHRRPAGQACEAYAQAFADRDCLKMVLDWRENA